MNQLEIKYKIAIISGIILLGVGVLYFTMSSDKEKASVKKIAPESLVKEREMVLGEFKGIKDEIQEVREIKESVKKQDEELKSIIRELKENKNLPPIDYDGRGSGKVSVEPPASSSYTDAGKGDKIAKGTALHQQKQAGEQYIQIPEKPLLKLQVFEFEPIHIVKQDTIKTKNKVMYLPSGSFVEATLLSGVYAPHAASRLLPVAVRIDKAFVGPNHVSIPLTGCFAVGMASGDIPSQRVQIRVQSLSCAFPSGRIFESKNVNAYVSDKDGVYGIHGKVEWHTLAFLSTVGLSSFTKGVAEGVAKAQQSFEAVASQTATAIVSNVTGQEALFAISQGFTELGKDMADFYKRQVEALIPAIVIEAGKPTYVHMVEGIEIEGGEELETVANHSYTSPYIY